MATRTSIATDDFNRAGPGLGANYAQLNTGGGGSMQIAASTKVTASAGNDLNMACARYVGTGTFTNDHYAEVAVGDLSFTGTDAFSGVITRASADTDANRDLYFAWVASNTGGPNYLVSFGKVVNGTRTFFNQASTAWSNGDRIGLESEGSTHRVTKNGTALGGSFTTTDTALTTGLPGICGANANSSLDNAEFGSLGSASSIAAISSNYRMMGVR
jgi:hypothetical protein